MHAHLDPILSQLAATDQRAFERALRALERRWEGVAHASRLPDLLTALRTLGSAASLGSTEVSRRVRLAVESARLPERQARELASSLKGLPPGVRQAAAGALPASLRRLVYAPENEGPGAEGTPSQAPDSPGPTESEPAPPPEPASARLACSNVLLLGTLADHEENTDQLKRRGFTPLRATTCDQLSEYLDPEVCGIVIARSWWGPIPEAERQSVLRQILAHSSFVWLKLDSHSLPCDERGLRELLLALRFSMPEMGECGCQDGWRLTSLDLDALERVRGTIANADAVRLYPAEIQETQARVLIGAAIKHVRQRNYSGVFRLTRVETNFIPGGKSFARIIRLIPDDDGAPLVAKVDEIGRLNDELMRFKRYAQKWDSALNPQLHFHAGTSLILFGLVESVDAPNRPAPTLEETLETLFYSEHYASPYTGPAESDLVDLIDRAVRKLQRLNQQPSDGACASRAGIATDTLETLQRDGVTWSISPCDGSGGNVLDFGYLARGFALKFGNRATVHGDVQLRNVLVRDNREPYFIDYANCGPGHPCFDLVRLESAILFYCFRMVADEQAVASLLKDVLQGADEATINQRHPVLCTSRTNRLAIHACIACRTAALAVLDQYGGNEDDYLAMKYLLSCQSLFLIHLQGGVVRSQLSALGAMLRQRPQWLPPPRDSQPKKGAAAMAEPAAARATD